MVEVKKRTRDKDIKKKAILEAAVEIFAEKGEEQMSLMGWYITITRTVMRF